ncbi:MAG: aminopeptidase P N-terminal domain-containing protein [Planctomycetes bacterium]|nr:aminopeptidase P N-terminal domain-containing protein [Planctomycetota bacterium]MBI3845571.1 aminopeptidase P N-terminal domain-containing protein [Planctomycetota bacterium]
MNSLACLLLAPAVVAGPMFTNQEFAGRRAAVFEKIGKGVAIVRGAELPGAWYRFRQSNDFFYLTGVESPEAVLLLDGKSKKTTLFLLPKNPMTESVEGARLSAGPEAEAATGIDDVRPANDFPKALDEILSGRSGEKPSGGDAGRAIWTTLDAEETYLVTLDSWADLRAQRKRDPFDDRPSREDFFAKVLKEKYPAWPVENLSPVLHTMRVRKSPAEVAAMRRACEITAVGLTEAIRACAPGRFEYEIAGIATGAFLREGAYGPAYEPIVGSGPNSCIIHYSDDHRRMEAGDIVVMDYAAEFSNYAADVTRTFPVSSRFTPRQREIYELVLRAQTAALAACKPGATVGEVNGAAKKIVDEAKLGKHWRHGTSHLIGMGVHDVGNFPQKLEPGVALTVEPGVYIGDESLGVRIEDVVVITETGYDLLSASMPKTVAEIEALRGATSGGESGK